MAGEAGPAINPIEQFSISPIVSIKIAGHDFSLTNSSLYMLIAVAIACALMAVGANGGAGVPGRLQALAEMAYEFVAGMVRSARGEAGMRFFPLVFSIFMFVLICNLDRAYRPIPSPSRATSSSPPRWRCWCSSPSSSSA